MPTKHGKVVTVREGLSSINMFPREVATIKYMYLHYQKPYSHKTYQDGETLQGTPTHKFG